MIPKICVHSCHLLVDHVQFSLIHECNISCSYVILFFITADFIFTIRHIQTKHCFHFGLATSFILVPFLCPSPVAYWTPADLGCSSFSVIYFCSTTSFWFWCSHRRRLAHVLLLHHRVTTVLQLSHLHCLSMQSVFFTSSLCFFILPTRLSQRCSQIFCLIHTLQGDCISLKLKVSGWQ